MKEILNRALKQDFPVKAIEKLSTSKRLTFKSIDKHLHEVVLNERVRCVYNSNTFNLRLFRNDILINIYNFSDKEPFRLVCEKINQLKESLDE